MRKFIGGRLILATHNKGKVPEIAALLAGRVDDIVTAGQLGLPEPDETEDSFAGNAALKALAAARGGGLPALADDSGLAVTALDGMPGIYSARWAGPGKDFEAAIERVRRELGDHPDRRAEFVCALALAWPDGEVVTVEGRIGGQLVFPGRGGNGFGYDPIFVPDGYAVTFGEMEPAEKARISHRARAFSALKDKVF